MGSLHITDPSISCFLRHAGPQQLFSDLKNNSAKKASGSNVFSKSPSRALGVKNTQSPQRSQDGASKPTIGKAKLAQLSFLDVSPVKGKAALTSPSKSSSNFSQHISPAKEAPISFAIPPLELDEGVSYHTTTTPHPAVPATPTPVNEEERSLHRQASFVTPTANIGEAGALRLRKGEMLDALIMAESEIQLDDANLDLMQATDLDEMYPDIEYIPPKLGKCGF
jgi:hypothetical protein